jgi:heat shock protein HslJ
LKQRVVLTATFAACMAFAGCGTTAPSYQPPTSNPAVSTQPPASDPAASTQPSATEPAPFDLSGTAWRATSVSGLAVPPVNEPRLEFDWLGRPEGSGFTGCDEFGFSAMIQGDRMSIGDLMLSPSACAGPNGLVEERFLTAFQATEAWFVEGDRLTLAGVPGEILFARELPPMGDPGRQLADALTDGEWRVVGAPGVVGLDHLSPVLFADALLIGEGECGFSSDIRFGSGGALDIIEVGWDAVGCGGAQGDGRLALKSLLEAVTMGRLDPDGTIVLSGPRGEVVLGR